MSFSVIADLLKNFWSEMIMPGSKSDPVMEFAPDAVAVAITPGMEAVAGVDTKCVTHKSETIVTDMTIPMRADPARRTLPEGIAVSPNPPANTEVLHSSVLSWKRLDERTRREANEIARVASGFAARHSRAGGHNERSSLGMASRAVATWSTWPADIHGPIGRLVTLRARSSATGKTPALPALFISDRMEAIS